MPTWWNWEGEIWLFPGQCWPYPLLHWEECCRQGPKRERLLWSPRRPKQSSLHRDYRELNYWTILYGDCNNIFYYPTSIWNAKRVLNAAQVMFNCLIFAQRLSVHHVKVYLQRKDGKLKAGQTKFESLNKAFPKPSAPHKACTNKKSLRAQIWSILTAQHWFPCLYDRRWDMVCMSLPLGRDSEQFLQWPHGPSIGQFDISHPCESQDCFTNHPESWRAESVFNMFSSGTIGAVIK